MAMTGMSNRFAAGLSAMAMGVALLALPAIAQAQQDDHHAGGNADNRGGNRDGGHRDGGGNGAGNGGGQPQPQPGRGGQGQGPDNRGPGQGGLFQPAPGNGGGGRGTWQGQSQQQFPQGRPGQGQAGRGQPGNGGPDRNDFGYDRGGHNQGGRGPGGYSGGPGRDGGPGGGPGGRYAGGGFDQGRHDGGQFDGGGRGQPGFGGGGRGRDGGPQWNHGWRQDNRYDWRDWRAENRDTFHVGRYYAPYRGYSYNRLSIGIYLQPMFFGSDYWLADPWEYRLPPAYGPYHWVRYYNDVLLVNTYNGEVADVIYDFFW